jgi:hypothetical protein
MLCHFRDGKLTRKDISGILQLDSITELVMVNKEHVIHMLQLYKQKRITENMLVDWVNVIWFSDYFVYQENEQESIASVMSELEELDEKEGELSAAEADYYIECLNKNVAA